MIPIEKYPDVSQLMSSLAAIVAEELSAAITEKGAATLAVPGGTTPRPFFKLLRTKSLKWSAVTVVLTDERCVPESSDRSNARLVREALLQDAAAAATFLPLQVNEFGSPPVDQVNALLPLDCCILGMGEDMHTASLFPNTSTLVSALSETATPVMKVEAPGDLEPRITLTAPVLKSSRHIHLLITGDAKLSALHDALAGGPVSEAPVRSVLEAGTNCRIHFAE